MATVIKHVRMPRTAGTQAAALEMSDLGQRAEQLLQNARDEAAKLLDQARHDAERIRSEAEQAGQKAAAESLAQLVNREVAGRLGTMLPAIEQLVSQLEDTRGDWLRHWEASAVKLATVIAERIVRRQLHEEPEIALDIIREALQLAAGSASVSIRLSPTDFQHLGSQVERLAETLCRLGPAKVVSDSSITSGGCRVETRFGAIDQQIETQLARIEEELI